MENFEPIQPLEERKEELKRNAEERRSEGYLTKKVREVKQVFQDPEEIIGPRDMALFESAEYTEDEIKWIAKVKKASDTREFDNLNAYDLVRSQAMLVRDRNRAMEINPKDPTLVSRETERYVDDMLARIISNYRKHGEFYDGYVRGGGSLTRYDMQIRKLLSEMPTADTIQKRASLLTRWLGVIHNGGNREVLDVVFGGFPWDEKGGLRERLAAQQVFLDKLNNLGKKNK